jgi:hypothetical protein
MMRPITTPHLPSFHCIVTSSRSYILRFSHSLRYLSFVVISGCRCERALFEVDQHSVQWVLTDFSISTIYLSDPIISLLLFLIDTPCSLGFDVRAAPLLTSHLVYFRSDIPTSCAVPINTGVSQSGNSSLHSNLAIQTAGNRRDDAPNSNILASTEN